MTSRDKSQAQSDSGTAHVSNTPKETERVEAGPRKRGFGGLDRAEVRKLAQKGGVAAHRAGTAHEFTGEEARAAGRKGGLATHARRREQAKDVTSAGPLTSSSDTESTNEVP
jgi:general stress protein YciG